MGRRERDEINNTYQGKTTFVCVCHEVLLSYKFNIIIKNFSFNYYSIYG